MTPDQNKIGISINYLTGGLVIPEGQSAVSDTTTLGRKIGLSADDAAAWEATLVGYGVIRPAPAYFNTPRYYITDAGRAFLIMCRQSTRAWAPSELLARIPEFSVFAGNELSFYIACRLLIQSGLATTADNGATFTLT